MRKYQKTRTILAMLLSCGVVTLFNGCATKAKSGALIGAGVGAGAGQLIGGDTEGTLIGGAVGAAAGYMIGNEADKEETRRHDNLPPED